MDGEKIMQTRQAVSQAIDLLHDDAWFCVIAGTDTWKGLRAADPGHAREPAVRAKGRAAPRRVRRDGHVHLAADRAGRIPQKA